MDDARLQTFVLEDGDEVRGSRQTLLTTYLLLKDFQKKERNGCGRHKVYLAALRANPSSVGITVTANGVPASSDTKGKVPPNSLPPSIEFS